MCILAQTLYLFTFHTYLWPWHFVSPSPSISHFIVMVLIEQIFMNKENMHKGLGDMIETREGLELEGEDLNGHLTVLFTT